MNLRQWRESKGLSYKEVAQKMDRNSPSTVFYWEERGVNSFKIRLQLKKISKGKINKFEPCI